MTAPVAMMLAGGGGVAQGANCSPTDVVAGTTATASLTLKIDGSIVYGGNQSSGTPRWTTESGAPGSRYWAKMTLITTGPTTGPVNVATQIASDVIWTWSRATVGTLTSSTTITFYTDAAATQQAGFLNVTATAQRT